MTTPIMDFCNKIVTGAGGTQANGAEVDVCWTDYRCDECGGEWVSE